MGDMVKGNIAVAEAAVRAGVEVYAGYPITPSTEAMEYLSGRMPELGRTFVQAESELAGINIIMGASACGPPRADGLLRPGHLPQAGGHLLHEPDELPRRHPQRCPLGQRSRRAQRLAD